MARQPNGGVCMPTIHEPVTLLRENHLGLTQLFRTFCTLAAHDGGAADRHALVSRIVRQLEHHLRTVEEVVWPVLYDEYPGEVSRDKAEVTHELLRTLMAQLSGMSPSEALFDARVFILMSLTRQALDAEECELFPVLRSARLRQTPQEVADGIVRRRAELDTAHQLLDGLTDLDASAAAQA
ncbi:MAG: hemerythrin domain-containing protein, partial [Rubrivivax sp.]